MAYPVMLPNSTWYKGTILISSLTEIHFKDSYTPTGTVTESWNADVDDNGSIKCYIEGTILTIAGNGSGKIEANADSSKMFLNFNSVTTISGLDILDTSNVTTMYVMFYKLSKLTSLDVSSWKVNNVKDMSYLFAGYGDENSMSLTSIIGLDKWNTNSLENMQGMFQRCELLTEINIGSWDVSNVTDMKSLFSYCSSIESLDLNKWITSSCTNMKATFANCYSLVNLNISNWNTSSCTDMGSMFNGCSSLTTLDISNWETSNCTTMASMFSGCSSLTTLDVSNWDTSSCTDMNRTFQGCTSLTELDVNNWNVSKVTNMNSMFSQSNYGVTSSPITELNVSNWDTSSCTDMGWMFYGLTSLKELDLGNWDVSKVVSMHHMFAWCHNLKVKGLKNWDTSSCTTFNAMFHSNNIEYIDISKWNTSNCNNFSQMFERARNLKYIKGLDKIDTSNVKSFYQMFFGCQSLRELDLSNFDTRNADDTWKDPYRDESEVTYGVKDMFGLIQNQYEDPVQKYYGYMRNLRKITFGPNFSFNGNGNCIPAVLEVPDTTVIPYADGYWYDENGIQYEAANINTIGTYYVANMNEDMLIKKGTIINISEAIHHTTGNYNDFFLKDVPQIIIDSNKSIVNDDSSGNSDALTPTII